MNRSKFMLSIFALASIGDIVSILGNFEAHYAFKPAIVLALMGYYWLEARERSSTFLRALFFCWLGDCLLMFTGLGELYFILGLIAFLIGHLFYIFCFRQMVWDHESQVLPTQKVRYVLPILLAGTGLISVLYPMLGSMKIPVMVYSVVIMLMASYSLFRLGRTTRPSFTWVFIGALLFMVSDSMLAINKFYSSFYLASVGIMVTYISAQYMIVKGVLLHRGN